MKYILYILVFKAQVYKTVAFTTHFEVRRILKHKMLSWKGLEKVTALKQFVLQYLPLPSVLNN